ncbi:MAG: OprO/OprP family phosphate-selective porin [Candidatus Anammoxibacter sp.]
MKKQIKGIVLITIIAILHNSDNLYAQKNPPIENIIQQMETLKREMAYQNDEIRELKARLDEEIGEKIANTFNEAVFVREDLDQIVDKKIEEYFENEDNREKLSSYIKLPLDMGYKEGFYFRTHDGKFSMKTNGRIQFRYGFEDFDRKDDDSSFRIRRARLKWTGNAYKDFKYKIELALKSTGSKDGSKSVELIDWWADYTRYPFAKIRFGQWKVPFNRQRVVSSENLQLIDRSVANFEFALNRQIGIQGFGKLFDKKLEYYFGFFNGNNRNESRNDNNKHMFIFRTSYNLLGGYGKGISEVESDIAYSETPLAHISGAIAFDSAEDVTLGLEDVILDTDGLVVVVPPSEVDRTSIVVEYGFKYKGFSAIGEYYWRKTHGIADANIIDQGFFAQAGYFLIPKKFEVTGRYSLVDFDDELKADAIRETTFGLNWFFAEHKSKLQFNATRIDNEKPGPDDIDYKYRFQYQLSF